jgi:hypothetical protein
MPSLHLDRDALLTASRAFGGLLPPTSPAHLAEPPALGLAIGGFDERMGRTERTLATDDGRFGAGLVRAVEQYDATDRALAGSAAAGAGDAR